jgi:hypothetical protein
MNASPLRGLAVLALLSLLPRVCALTITQTGTFNFGGGGQTDGRSGGWAVSNGGFVFAKWDSPEALSSIRIDITWGTSITSMERNPFTQPPQLLTVLPNVRSEMTFTLAPNLHWHPSNQIWSTPTTIDIAADQLTILQPGTSVTFSSGFTHTDGYTITDPNVLGALVGSDSGRIDIHQHFFGFGAWGFVHSSGNATVTMTLNGEGTASEASHVPEHGFSAIMLCASLAGLFAAHRRRKRSLPTE